MMIHRMWSWYHEQMFCFWSSRAARSMPRIGGFQQAQRYFEKTRKPNGKAWQDNERPLYNTRSHHYRIAVNTDGSSRTRTRREGRTSCSVRMHLSSC